MKVLQINATYGYLSTGLIVKDIGQVIKDNGDEAFFAYQTTNEKVENGYCVGNKLDWKIHAVLARLLGRQAYHSKGATRNFLKYLDEINPDVVHLHNLHSNYINLNMLLDYLAKKDIATVITMHDCWYFTGKCFHYIDVGCDRFTNGCGNCPKQKAPQSSFFFDRSADVVKDREKYLTAIPRLKIVGCSQWICNEAKKGFLQGADISAVWNGLNTEIFKPRDKAQLKKQNDCENKFVIMGMANKWLLPANKTLLERTLEEIKDNEILMIVGCKDEHKEELKKFGDKVKAIGFITDREKLAEYYSMADVFVNPTHADTLPTVNMESICCGTPVVTYDVCGSSELILDGCGEVVPENDVEGIISAFRKITGEDCAAIGANAFDRKNSYKKYLDIYGDVLRKDV